MGPIWVRWGVAGVPYGIEGSGPGGSAHVTQRGSHLGVWLWRQGLFLCPGLMPQQWRGLPGQTTAVDSLVSRDKAGVTEDAVTKQDSGQLVDSAKCEVYVCFEGPLGAHLKPKIHEKI